jgi:hypothetical protein
MIVIACNGGDACRLRSPRLCTKRDWNADGEGDGRGEIESGVTVLDFGLAKMTGSATAVPEDTATVSQAILGTPAYMSPEQCEGKPCDARADIFALGLVLYQMALGRRAFQGESRAALTAEILRCEPPLDGLPPLFAHVVERCLAKDPDKRWQSARDIALHLEYQAQAGGTTAPAKRKRSWWPVVAALAVLTVIAVAVIPRTVVKEAAVTPLTSYPGDEIDPSLSADGSQAAFSWRSAEPGSVFHIWVKQVGFGNALQLTKGNTNDIAPRWSPDGRWVAFLRDDPCCDAYLIPTLGGMEHKVTGSVGSTLEWSPDGRGLVVAKRGSPERRGSWALVSIDSGEVLGTLAIPPDAQPRPIASLAPDGHALAFPLTNGGLVIQPLSNSFEPNGPVRRIPFRPGTISGLAWSADSRDIIFAYGNVGVQLLRGYGRRRSAGRQPFVVSRRELDRVRRRYRGNSQRDRHHQFHWRQAPRCRKGIWCCRSSVLVCRWAMDLFQPRLSRRVEHLPRIGIRRPAGASYPIWGEHREAFCRRKVDLLYRGELGPGRVCAVMAISYFGRRTQ